MIGLVNAVGAAQAARQTPAGRNTTGPPVGEPPMWIRPTEQPETERAVGPVEFQQAQAERHVPDGDASQEFDRTEMVERSTGDVGAVLDVVG